MGSPTYRILKMRRESFFRAQKLIRGEWKDLEPTISDEKFKIYSNYSEAKKEISIDIDRKNAWETYETLNSQGEIYRED